MSQGTEPLVSAQGILPPASRAAADPGTITAATMPPNQPPPPTSTSSPPALAHPGASVCVRAWRWLMLRQAEAARAGGRDPGCGLQCRGGFDIIEGLVDPRGADLLLHEALGLFAGATPVDVASSDDAEWRGGAPARRFLSASGGPAQDSLYQSDWLRACLTDIVGARLAPSGPRGTYTYYTRTGDFLALHRDIDICDGAAITCLHDGPSMPPGAGSLHLYPPRGGEPLASIRSGSQSA